MTEPDIEAELDAIERAVHRARGVSTDGDGVHPMDFRLPTGPDLRRMRERCGLSAETAAERIGVVTQTIYGIENGNTTPSMQTLQQCLRLYRMEWPQGGERR